MNNFQTSSKLRGAFIAGIALLVSFSAVAKGAHDLWAATTVYLGLLGLGLIFIMITPTRGIKGIHFPLLGCSLAVLIILIISFWQSVNPSESFLGLLDWMAFLMMFFLCANIVQTDTEVKLLLALLVPVFLIEYTVVFKQWLEISYAVRHSLYDYQEPVGTFVNANSTVAFCLLWFPYLIEQSVFPTRSSRRTRWYWSIGAIALALILMMVASTWSLVCLVTGGLVYVGRSRLRRVYNSNRVLSQAVLILLVGILLALIWYKFALIYGWGGVHPNRYAPTSRIGWWMSGFKMWKDHPWFGVGIGNFPSAYLTYKTGIGFSTLYAHSAVVQILAETGTFGLGAILLFISSCLYRARSTLFGSHKSVTVGLFMFLLFSTIHVSFEYLSHLLALGLFLGILLVPTKKGFVWVPRLPAKILIAGLTLCAVPYVVSPFLASRLWVDGKSYVEEKKWDLAEKSFRSAVELDPRAWEPYNGLAHCAASRGDVHLAADYQRQAVDRNKLNLKLREELNYLERLQSIENHGGQKNGNIQDGGEKKFSSSSHRSAEKK